MEGVVPSPRRRENLLGAVKLQSLELCARSPGGELFGAVKLQSLQHGARSLELGARSLELCVRCSALREAQAVLYSVNLTLRAEIGQWPTVIYSSDINTISFT